MENKKFKVKKVLKNIQSFRGRLSKENTSYLESKAGPMRVREIAFKATDLNGKMIGGLFGITYWNCFIIEELWIHSQFQGQGIGKSLVQLAEKEAKKKKCGFAYLTASSLLPAPGFYRKMGYREFARLKGFSKGRSSILFTKKL